MTRVPETVAPNTIDSTTQPLTPGLTDAAGSRSTPAEPAIDENAIDENAYLTLSTPGLLNSLHFRTAPRQLPGPGEVEIEVGAVGVNFKEVLLALGLIPLSPEGTFQFGLECAGTITALGFGVEGFTVGDDVIAFGTGCCRRWMTTSARLVAHRPAHLSLEEAATIPIAFATAYYALITVGRLSQGERLLIHSAAGGVGMAAVAIAKWVEADIFATAGNAEKRDFLRSQGISQVMDSRSLAFADQIMKSTDGQGVDVVLNALGGEFIPKSLSVLGRYGRFLELGQRDILNDTPLGLGAFEKRLSFFAIQVEPSAPGFDAMWQAVVQHFHERHFQPLPYRVFSAADVADAFGYMAAAKHIGKVVIVLGEGRIEASSGVESAFQKRDRGEGERGRGGEKVRPHGLAGAAGVFPKDFLEAGLSPAEGVIAFRRILGSGLPQVLVSKRELGRELGHEPGQRSDSRQVNAVGGAQGDTQGSAQMGSGVQLGESLDSANSADASHPRPPLSQSYVAPRTPLEEAIAAIWQQFLGISPVGIHDSFFELGGHSLMATQVVAQMSEIARVELSLNTLFDQPTVAQVADYVEQVQKTTQLLTTPIDRKSDDRAEIEL